MTDLNELQTNITTVLEDETCILTIYALLEVNNILEFKKVNFVGSLQDELKDFIQDSIKTSNVFDAETSLLKLSECDDRRNVICELDEEIEGEMAMFASLDEEHGEDMPIYNMDEEIHMTKGLIICLGNSEKSLQIYRHINPIAILGKKRFVVINRSENRLERETKPLMMLYNSFQAIRLDSVTYITNIKFIESNAGYSKVVHARATNACSAILKYGCIDNIDALEEMIEDDASFARKLSRISEDSPVIKNNIPHEEIIDFCKNYPALKNKIRFNDSETKIVLDTKVSKNLILKVFLDDMLISELTKLHYESHAKDKVNSEESSGESNE